MWLLVANIIANIIGYFIFGLLTGHFWRNPLSLPPIAAYCDLKSELAALATHTPGVYSPIQRALYIYVAVTLIVVVVSGLAIWKPVQFQTLTNFFGGYGTARKADLVL
jgi:thiosulfate reductase cytochrome b subunit